MWLLTVITGFLAIHSAFLIVPPLFRPGCQQKDDKNYTGSYLIVAPKVIRPGRPYAVSVNLINVPGEATVELQIRNSKNESIDRIVVTDAGPGKPKTGTFKNIPTNLPAGETYKLYAKGDLTSGTNLFQDEAPLSYNAKSYSIFVQTDKAVYKPSATVNYRVIVVQPDLKPWKGSVDILLSDPQKNVLQQKTGVQLEKGVTTQALTLSDEPPLGAWTIQVHTAEQKYSKTFDVDKYVLPKFEVKLDPPSIVTLKDDISVGISAKYTFGKGVQGKATVLAEYPYYSSEAVKRQRPPIEKEIDLDNSGNGTVRFSNAELKEHKLIEAYNSRVKFTGTVVETLTGISRNSTITVTIYKNKYKLDIKKSSETYKPGLEYNLLISVTSQDGKPLANEASHDLFLNITYNFPYDSQKNTKPTLEKKTVQLDSDGTYTLTITPVADSQSLQVQAKYENENSDVAGYASVQASKSPTSSYLQLSTDKPNLKAGDTATFNLKSTENLQSVTMQVLSRGYVVDSRQIAMNGVDGTISFLTTPEMAPKSRIIVYAVRDENKEILVDSMNFRVQGLFQNDVQISVNPTKVSPYDAQGKKAQVEFRIKADPQSFVGLLAVDQSVKLLKEGNDITQNLVEQDIAGYDSSGIGSNSWMLGKKRRKRSAIWYPWWVGGKDAFTVMQNSGIVTLTDAYLYQECSPAVLVFPGFAGGGLAGAANGPRPAAAPAKVQGDGLHNAEATTTADSIAAAPKPQLRSLFPETWLWVDETADANGEMVYKVDVPDTITSWIASAFALNDDSGLGVAPEPAKVEVFRPFFIRMNLPYSVKRGEKFALQVLIFNYNPEAQKVTVQLEHNENSGFDFIDNPRKSGVDGQLPKNYNVRQVEVPGDGGSKAVFFPIRPNIIGDLKLKATAYGSAGSSDAVQETLLCESEGVPLFFNKPLLLDLTQENLFKREIDIKPPSDVKIVEGSERAEVSMIGDIMGPVLSNIDELVRMPSGCGEQNMLNFVPNIVVRRYLEATNRLSPELDGKTKKFMEAGYQRELQYMRDDHSFSAFGNSDKHGSTWLSAFVARSFKQAQKYINVDGNILKDTMKFLKSQQKDNGEFEEHGEIHHKDMQGGSGKGGVPLTAYTLVAFLENDDPNPVAVKYLEDNLESIANDPYALAITTYALELAQSPKREDAAKMLQKHAIVDESTKHWEDTSKSSPKDETTWYWNQPRPANVEMTGYALLTYMLKNQVADGLPIVRWLVSKRNSLGGFTSTQDTVIGIMALGAYAQKAYSSDMNIDLVANQGEKSYNMKITPGNSIVLQKQKVGGLDQPISIEAKGNGIGFAQVSWHYNVPKLQDQEPFDCQEDVMDAGGNEMTLHLCCKYGLSGQSNMAVIELDAPSGYTVDGESLKQLPKQIKDLQRVELLKQNTKAAIYFNKITATPVCFNVTNELAFPVAEHKPARIHVFDYYEPKNSIEHDYGPRKKRSLEESCDECWMDTYPDWPEGALARSANLASF